MEKNRFDFAVPEDSDESSDYDILEDEFDFTVPDGSDESSDYDIPKDQKYLVRCGGDGSSDYVIPEDRSISFVAAAAAMAMAAMKISIMKLGRKLASIAAAMKVSTVKLGRTIASITAAMKVSTVKLGRTIASITAAMEVPLVLIPVPDGSDESSDYLDGSDESSDYDIPKDRKYLVRCGGDRSSDYEIPEDRKYLVRCAGGAGDCGDESFNSEIREKNSKYCGSDGSSVGIHSDFLCARSKTHLIRWDGSPVEIASLSGKMVGILFFLYGNGDKGALSYDNLLNFKAFKAFKAAYEWTREVKGDVFEIVSVGLGCSPDDDKENWELQRRMFDELILPDMSWLAVPFDEWEWRERLQVKYIDSYFGSFDIRIDIVDGTSGRLVLESADSSILCYGPYSYPFTLKRLEELYFEGERMLKQKSLEALLGDSGSGCDFLFSNNGTKVPISQLQGKEIGLYLCREIPFSASSATYPFSGNDCSGRDKVIVEFLLTCPSDFKIVIINDHLCGGYTDETSLLQVLNRLPNNWFALPFKNFKTRALLANLPFFATVGPDGDLFCDAYPVILRYGLAAYPFTFRAAADAEIRRLTKLNLADVFEALDIDFVYKKLGPGGENYTPSSFPFPTPDKKGVVLYIHHCFPLPEARRLRDLSLSSPFHVIFCDSANTFDDFVKLFDTMPMQWSALPHGHDFKELSFLFPDDGHVIAFGSDGNLLKVGTLESFGRHGNDVFPFISQEDFIMTVEKYLAEYLADPYYSSRFFRV